MRQYFISRLKTVARFLGWGIVFCILTEVIFRRYEPVQLIRLFYFLAFAMPFYILKPNWFLMLPHSRSRLLLFHFIETSLILFSVCITIFAIEWYFISVRHYAVDRNQSIQFLVLGGMVFVASCVWSIGSYGINRVQLQSGVKLQKRGLLILGLLYVLIFLIWYFLAKEPWFVAAGVLGILFFLPSLAFKVIRTPQRTQRKISAASRACYLVTCACIIAAAISAIEFGPSQSYVTNTSLLLFGHIAVYIPIDRVSELFESSSIGAAPVLLRRASDVKNLVSYDSWLARTRKCKTTSCLDLSDAFLRDDLSPAQKQGAFYEFMVICRPGVRYEAYIRCLGPRLSPARLDKWLEDLNTSGTTDVWLKSENSIRQLVAIRALAKSQPSIDQVARINDLAKNGERLVRLAADHELNDYLESPASTKQSTCGRGSTSPCLPTRLSDLF